MERTASRRPIWYQRVPTGFWSDGKNRRAFLEWFEAKLGLRTPEDWYRLKTRDFSRFGGGGFLGRYGGSVFNLVIDYMPWYDWKEWLFPQVPQRFWDDPESAPRYLEWLGEKLGYKSPEDWYQVVGQDFLDNRGGTLLTRFKGSPSAILMHYYPDYDWKEWLFKVTQKHFWTDPKNRRRYLEWLGEQLGYRDYEDWYKIRMSDLQAHSIGGLKTKYDGSPMRILVENFPEYEWLGWRFNATSRYFWDDPKNCRRYMEWLGAKLGFKDYEDWYRLGHRHFQENFGITLLTKHKSSPALVVKATFPGYDWKEWLFPVLSSSFFEDRDRIRAYLEWLQEQLGYESYDDWYQLTTKDLLKHRGCGLLERYNASPLALVIDLFPEYKFHEWLFAMTPTHFWHDVDNCRRAVEWLGELLEVETLEDWYEISAEEMRRSGLGGLVKHYGGSSIAVMKALYPDYPWLEWRFPVVTKGFWKVPANCRRFFEWLAKEWGVEEPKGWYRIRREDVAAAYGNSPFYYHDQSYPKAVVQLFPEYDLKEWLFLATPAKFWRERGNRRRYLEWLGKELGIRKSREWQSVRCYHLIENRGKGLVRLFGGSIRDILLDAFPKSHPVHRVARDMKGSGQGRRRASAP